ncbi:MAG: PilC/PilY family type IV pilus protein [Sinimarinibacterium sp.]|jgi:type IV pilus assembly protein PilY1
MLKKARLAILSAAIVVLSGRLYADDTDIYILREPPEDAAPLVMFSLDYRANLTSTICAKADDASCSAAQYFANYKDESGNPDAFLKAQLDAIGSGKFYFFDLLRLALYVVTSQSEFKNVKVGLMMSHNTENNCVGPAANKCSNGGAILFGFRRLGDAGVPQDFQTRLTALRGIKSGANSTDHEYQGAELFFEYYRYITGGLIFNAHNGAVDYESGNKVNRNTNMDKYAPASWDTAIERVADKRYVNPLDEAGKCTRLYTMNFMFGNSVSDSDSNSYIDDAVDAGGLGVPIPNNDPFEAVIRRLNQMDVDSGLAGLQSVTSYFFVKSSNQTNKVSDYAEAGGTVARAAGDDPESLIEDITAIFREILATSTTFVAASVPVNVFNRAAVVNNVYIALFEADAKPYWVGNLKKLQIDTTSQNDPVLVDALNNNAIVADGRIRFDALTFWTDPTQLTDSDPANNIYAGRDGRHVNRGGAGQKIPGFISGTPTASNADAGARQLLYFDGSTLAALDATDTKKADAGVQAQLGTVGDEGATLQALKYIRGYDSFDEDGDANFVERRKWIMGDPLHSRPLPINFGSTGDFSVDNPGIYVAVGSNDGFMRLVRNTTTGGNQSGEEVWAFMPPEGMKVQTKLGKNLKDVADRHPYSVDGAPAALVLDQNQDGEITGSDKVYLYFGLRRGGKSYYAIDITNPVAPNFAWRATNATADFAEVGLSFSQPKIGVVKVDGTDVPVAVVTGGYDENKDTHGLGTDDTTGQGLYVVNALTGKLIWKAVKGASTGPVGGDDTKFTHSKMLDSVPSDPTVVDTDGDGLIDRVLFGDSGGKIWRADITTAKRDKWKLTLLANVGRHASYTDGLVTRMNDRRFFHEPDIARVKDPVTAQIYDAVVVGSGDRENPLDYGGAPKNWFYMIKDRNLAVGSATDSTLGHEDLADITDGCLLKPDATPTTCGLEPKFSNGWRLQMEETGEKVLAAPLTLAGTVFFTSYIPTTLDDACEPSEGTGRVYAVDLYTGNPLYSSYNDETGLQVTDRFQQLDSPGIPAQVVFVPGMPADKNILRPDLKFTDAPSSSRLRTFWHRQ